MAAEYAEKVQRSNPRSKAAALMAARALALAHDHRSCVRMVYNHFRDYLFRPARGLPGDFWHLYYPRPFWREVNTAARNYGLDPSLMLSLMRQESRFDPTARSRVGAIGLFQIMPYTAEEIGPKIGVKIEGVDDLYDPFINSHIAATLAKNLLEQFGYQRAPTIASYNAGEDRVLAWWSAAVQEDISEDLFIDTIPYRETRNFVREVLTNYFAYQRIYSPGRVEIADE
jgi:soluble lytic murein transglycosylase